MARQTIAQRIALEGGEAIRKELEALGRDGERAFKKLQAAANQLKGPPPAFVQNLKNAAVQMERMGRTFVNAGQNIRRAGRSISMYVTAPIVALGALTLKTAADFETSMNRVAALTGSVGAEFESLGRLARDLGASTVFSASEAAEAMGFLAQAGFTVQEIFDALPGTLQLAASAQLGLAESANIVSQVLRGYSLDASQIGRVNDALVATFTKTNTNLQDLGEAFSYVGPLAKSAGLEFEEVAAALGLMAQGGFQGSRGGTALAQALNKILNTSPALAKELKKLGIELLDSDGRIKSLEDVVRELEPQLENTGLFLKIFGQRAGPGMVALVAQGSKALRELRGEIDNAGGIAQRVADIQMRGLNGAIEELSGAFEELQLAIADSGFLQQVTKMTLSVTEFVRELAEASPETLNFFVKLAAAVALVGPVILALGLLVTAIGRLGLAVSFLIRYTLVPLGLALAGLSGPAGLVVAALVALGVTAGVIATRIDETTAAARRHSSAMRDLASAIEAAKNGGAEELEQLRELTEAHLSEASAALKSAETKVAAQLKTVEALRIAQERPDSGELFGTVVELAEEKLKKLQQELGARRADLQEELGLFVKDVADASGDATAKVIQDLGTQIDGAKAKIEELRVAYEEAQKFAAEPPASVPKDVAAGILNISEEALNNAKKNLADLQAQLSQALSAQAQGITEVDTAIKAVSKSVDSTVTIVKGGLQGVSKVIVELKDGVNDFGRAGEDSVAIIKGGADGISVQLEKIAGDSKAAGDSIARTYGQTREGLVQIAGALDENLQPVVDNIFRVMDDTGRVIQEEIVPAGQSVGNVLVAIGETAQQQVAVIQQVSDTAVRIVDTVTASQEGLAARAQETVGALQASQVQADVAANAIIAAASRAADGWAAIPAAVSSAASAAQTAAGSIVAAFNGIAGQIGQQFSGVAGTIESVFQSVVAAVQSQIAALKAAVAGLVSSMVAQLNSLRSAIASAQSQLGAARAAASRRAGGGPIYGPGTATSDSILARLSAGEFVIKARAVRHYGQDLFAALNAMRLPRGGFNVGGLVSALTDSFALPRPAVPAFAGGGAVSSGRPVNLTIGGETFGLSAENDTVERLNKFILGGRAKSLGRRPSWYQ